MAKKKENLNNSTSSAPFRGASIIERDKILLSSPVIICGFVGPGLAALTSVGYVIDHLGLHQIAHVRSRHIPPAVVFIGGKIRHPFRIYKDGSGKVVVVICEIPIDRSGLYEISTSLLDWFQKSDPKEIVILDGIPINGLPENRPTFYVADENRQSDLKSFGFLPAESTLISGTAGSILSECLDRNTKCVSFLVPVSIAMADPGAPLTLIRALNSVYGLNITTKELEEDVAIVHEELNEIAKQYQKVQEQLSAPKEGEVSKTIYG